MAKSLCVDTFYLYLYTKFEMVMATREEVEAFLSCFQDKLKVFNIIFCNREKNTQALADLDITPLYRETVIKEIAVEDYSEGPIVDTINKFGDMWVFGKENTPLRTECYEKSIYRR